MATGIAEETGAYTTALYIQFVRWLVSARLFSLLYQRPYPVWEIAGLVKDANEMGGGQSSGSIKCREAMELLHMVVI
jgi:hypothetical protein